MRLSPSRVPSMRREQLYLADIVKAADAVANFITGLDAESFYKNTLVESAVSYQLMIIGEAAAHLSKELRERYADVPWDEIIGFRNHVVHEYFGTNWPEVWGTASEEAPLLRTRVAKILALEFPQ
jgi:uncharacterized protein with HEPN domain